MDGRLKKSLKTGGREDRASEEAKRDSADEKFVSTQ
jgi:hypothetical protein